MRTPEEKAYETMCINCEYEKRCNEELDYCDDYLDKVEEIEEIY